ncbi:MAG: M48 family metallopeptidase [Alphaproteobacteria bacterium]
MNFVDSLKQKAEAAFINAVSIGTIRPFEEEDKPRLKAMVKQLSDMTGLPERRLFVIEKDERDAKVNYINGDIAISRGTLQQHTAEEVCGIIAHEMGHTLSPQFTCATFGTNLVKMGVLYFASLSLFAAGSLAAEGKMKNAAECAEITVYSMIAFAALEITSNAVSRRAEKEADAIGNNMVAVRANGSTASRSTYFEHVLVEYNKEITTPAVIDPLFNLLSTHPSYPSRIAAAEAVEKNYNPDGTIIDFSQLPTALKNNSAFAKAANPPRRNF